MASTSVLRLRRAADGISRQVSCRVQVPVQHHTAVAPIRANVQRHRLNPATTATRLRGRKPAAGLHEAHAGRPALVLELTDEAAHASIRHGTRRPTVLHHAAHVQVFHDNTRCAPHDLRTGLVLGVTAQAGRPVMSRRQSVPPALAALRRLVATVNAQRPRPCYRNVPITERVTQRFERALLLTRAPRGHRAPHLHVTMPDSTPAGLCSGPDTPFCPGIPSGAAVREASGSRQRRGRPARTGPRS